MRLILLAAILMSIFSPALAQAAGSQDAVEQEIRRLERRDAEAVLRGDFAAMEATWSDDFTVNSPRNQITHGKQKVLELIKASTIGTYASFVRETETVLVHGDTAIAIGLETVTPTSTSSNQAGQVVRRRYMNVWTRQEGAWLLTARHVNVLTPD